MQKFVPGSFRDRAGRVFTREGRIFRAVRADALENWRSISQKPFYRTLEAEKKIVRTIEAPDISMPGWSGVLEHERIAVISYPYEWPFTMLKKAALHTLEVTEQALTDGIALRDATPYNIQWQGTTPRFIDVLSFELRRPGALWDGYRQFCETFLYPLMLASYLQLPYQPWLRGSLDGISTGDAARLLSPRKLYRAGVFKHVYLHAMLQRSMRGASSNAVSDAAAQQADDGRSEIVRRTVRGMTELVESLQAGRTKSHWTGYEQTKTYSDAERARKEAFVAESVRALEPALTLDLGCNTGTFSRIAASTGGYVVAVDADHDVIEDLARDASDHILPLLWDLADPSPSLGWRLRERPALTDRLQPDLVLCLALIHHLVIGRNIPTDEVVDELAKIGAATVIEFVDRHDPMVRRLLDQKRETFDDYTLEQFEHALAQRFTIERREPLESGSRVLYFARPRS